MKNSKQLLITLLVCLNVGLLAMLMVGPGARTTQAQIMGGTAPYVTTSALYDPNQEAIFVVDLVRRKLVAFRLEQNAAGDLVLRELSGRDLVRDFGR